MAKKTLANTETDQDVHEFLEAVTPKRRKEDSKLLVELMEQITGKPPKIWGKSIVAFGKYTYQRKNGEEYEWFNVGFSPGKSRLSLYFMFDLTQEPLLDKLGPHDKGKGCLYLKNLEQVNMDVLKEMIRKSDRW